MAAAMILKERDDSTDAEFCHACGAPFDPESLICVKCGFDKRTGRRVGEEEPPLVEPALRKLLGVLALVIVGAGGYFLLRDRFQKEIVLPPPASTANSVASASATTEAESAPAFAPTPLPATAPSQTQAVAGQPAATAAVDAVAAPATPAPPVIDRADLAPAREQQLRATIDEKFPLVKNGESVALRTTGGVVWRGVLLGRNGDRLLIADETLGGTQAVDLATLDRNSRLQVDGEFRERFVQYRMQQWVQSTNEPP